MVEPERALWLAALAQAFSDALYGENTKVDVLARRQARTWLAGAGKDFQQVCTFAGLEPDYVSRFVEKHVANLWEIPPQEYQRHRRRKASQEEVA